MAVPVALILDPTLRVRTLVRYVEERLPGSNSPTTVSFAAVHGAGATTVRAADLRLDRFLAQREIDAPRAPASPQPEVVFLTGATGFLGRFLLLALAERLPRARGKVIALVRAPGDAEALARLAAAYAGPDRALPARFAALVAEGRVAALAGDLIAPRFGLAPAAYDRLCEEVSAVVHDGALVNHTLSYAQLFEPNVLGTVEVMRLALRRRVKPVGYISTVGVAAGLDRTAPIREDEDGRALWGASGRPVDSGYAVGYSTSKWAGEVLLADLFEREGVPVDVFRCSMILPPRAFAGQVNAGDLLTRLLHGIVVTGLAPRSFYAGPDEPAFEGFPVDFVASAVAAITLDPRPGHATYHFVPQQAASLDTWVDWIEAAGYPVKRIDDHARWYAAFRERLEALAPAQRARSALPILHQWEQPLRRRATFDAQRLRERLAGLGPRGVGEIPGVDAAFVRKYLADMAAIGLIERPGAR